MCQTVARDVSGDLERGKGEGGHSPEIGPQMSRNRRGERFFWSVLHNLTFYKGKSLFFPLSPSGCKGSRGEGKGGVCLIN